ncbi:MAG TPA: tetratricopeptide repeat protein [Candidatus Acidoferrales bacterium]|nr:tetratricopeptide repeat protein [Candidatus Acidoferrales bacterium]
MNIRNAPAKTSFAVSRGAVFLAGGLLVLAVLVAYHNSFSGQFVLDDGDAITENQTIRHFGPIWPVQSPVGAGGAISNRPVLHFSYVLNYAISGLDVWSYHAVNLAVHILGGLLLFGVVRRTLLRLGGSLGAEALPLALMTALIWTVHPVQTGSVTYISQRAESLMGVWYLLTLYCFIRGVNGSCWWHPLAVFTCLLGMATKEAMVTAPLVVLFYDRVFVAGSWREAWRQRWRVYLALMATWLLLAYLMIGLTARGAGYGLGVTWWGYALTECWVVVHYLKLTLWPHPLIFDYGPQAGSATGALYVVALVLLVVMALLGFLWRPRPGFAGLWFFVILAPTSSVVPVAFEPMGENRLYLPLAGVVVLAVLCLHALLGKRSWFVLGALVVGCGFLTVRRNEDYRSALSIWTDTVAKQPDNARAHNNLGYELYKLGRLTEAIGHYQEALRLEPNDASEHDNLATALFQAGQPSEAVREFDQALQLGFDDAGLRNNFGLALVQVGRIEEAIEQYEAALRLDANNAAVHNNLGNVLLQMGRGPEAGRQFEAALRIDPHYAEAYVNLGTVSAQNGQMDKAVQCFREAVRLKPDYADAHFNLGIILFNLGQMDEAIGQYQEVLRLKPDDIQAHSYLGEALAKVGRIQEAIGQFEEVLRLKPGDTAALEVLGKLRPIESTSAGLSR